jgi:hypothetical protein
MDLNRSYGPLDPQTSKDIDAMFDYQPWNEEQVEKGKLVRAALANACKVIVAQVPPGPDRIVAIRKLREARMDCNSAITFGGRL